MDIGCSGCLFETIGKRILDTTLPDSRGTIFQQIFTDAVDGDLVPYS